MDGEVTQPSNSGQIDVEECVKLYLELRDTKAALTEKLKTELKPYNEGMEKLEAILLKYMQDIGAKNIATPAGTVYQRVERSATTRDKKAFRDFVLAGQLFDLLEWRPSKVQVFDHIEKTQADVPGINTQAYMTIGVRSGNES